MNTSYFASPKIKNLDLRLVSIARKTPNWFIKYNKIYKPLCPSWDLVAAYKKGNITKEQYTERYYLENLYSLDATKTYEELGEESILLCYEASLNFCHRHIVAKWLMDKLNVIITEL